MKTKTALFRKNIVSQTGRTRRFAPTANCYRLLLLLLCPTVGMAQNGITISNFAAAPGTGNAPTTLTFNIEWKKLAPDVVWSDTVWVFVDYNNKGAMTRLPLATGATLTDPSWDGAQVMEVENNDQGVWVVGNSRADGSFSATVQLCRDVARHVSTGMCVYAINYPPVGRYTAANQIKFNGTPPFYLTYSNGSAATVTADQAMSTITLTGTLASFTDASLAPGVTKCKTPAPQTLTASAYCAGTSVKLALANTERGATYLLYKGGVPQSGATATLIGTGSAATFTGNYTPGSYTVQVTPSPQFCDAGVVAETVTLTEIAIPGVPSLSYTQSSSAGAAIFEATDGSGTYQWSTCWDCSGATNTTPASYGNYTTSVQSVIIHGDLTCASAFTDPLSAIVKGLDLDPCSSAGDCVSANCLLGACYPSAYALHENVVYAVLAHTETCPTGFTNSQGCVLS